jgi:hypothetical protein
MRSAGRNRSTGKLRGLPATPIEEEDLVMHQWWPRMWAALLWAALGGCATGATPAPWQPGNTQPLIVGWPQYFDIRWGVTRTNGGVLIEGYITNTWGFVAQNLRVLVNGYDSSGAPTGQLIAWGPKEIEPGGREYFDVTAPGGSATYDVSIISWTWKWPPSGTSGVPGGSWSTPAGHAGSPVRRATADAAAGGPGAVQGAQRHH